MRACSPLSKAAGAPSVEAHDHRGDIFGKQAEFLFPPAE